jgi:5-methylcytosine-specific restriction endonuclease McrA
MSYTKAELRRIWASTAGRCHLSGKCVRLSDYGSTWEVDHSKPRAKGGSDHGNNLKPATLKANRSKQARSSRAARRDHGLARSPMSKKEQGRRRGNNTAAGLAMGAGAGAAIGGPPGALIGGLLGALFGNGRKVE